jgi:radical SAM superfamily enzyme YgiQ (UPF0313 family)
MKAVLCAVNSKFIHSSFAAHILYHHIDKTLLDVDVMEFSINDDMDSILRNLYKSDAEVFLFSVYIFNVEFIKKLIGKLKKIIPACIVILGGPEVSFDAEDFLSRINSADIIIKGEGEYTLNNVLRALYNKADLCGLSNIVYRKGEEIITTREEMNLMNLDDIIFPYNKENLALFKNKIIYYESSRGCPFQCAYCMSSVEKQLRYKSLNKVFNELSFFIENQIPIVKFTDRTFNTDASRAQKIWKFIKDNNTHTTFHFEIAADLLTEENISLLSQMPLAFVQLEAGIQSIKKQTLQAVSRKNDSDKIKSHLKQLTKNANIHIHTDLIAGLPFEDYKDFKKSFNFVYDLHSDMLQLGFLKLLKGSPMMDLLKDGAYVYDEAAPYEIIKNKWISYEDILNLKAVEMMVDKFYNSQSFMNILEHVINKYYEGNAFDFFEQLGIYFRDISSLEKKLSKTNLYEILACFLECKNKYTQTEEALLQFDFLLSNSSLLPKSLYLPQILKSRLYDLLMHNRSVIPSRYASLSYKQLIKHVNVFEFYIHPLTDENAQTFIAFWDFKQSNTKNQRYYTVLNKF